MGGHGVVNLVGEITSKAEVDPRKIVREIVGEDYRVEVNISQQSPSIAAGVDQGGAGTREL